MSVFFTAGSRRRSGPLRHRLKGRVLRFSTAADRLRSVTREHGLLSRLLQLQMLAGFPSLCHSRSPPRHMPLVPNSSPRALAVRSG